MEVGINFKNIKSYNENMAKGMEDKLFFLSKLNFKKDKSYLFVDFGCADGVLLDTLYGIMEANDINCYFIGYDISDTMIELAKTKFSHYPTYNVIFTTDWKKVEEKVKTYSAMESVLILSSVIHEVYSYANIENNDIFNFWKNVRNTGFKYVCVRDMMCSEDINRKPEEDIINEVMEHIPFATTISLIKTDFEKKWGSIHENNKNLVHFLLKYRWQINWERELNEDYFPIYISELLDRMNEKYNLIYFNRFRVPFLDKCFKEDFNIELNDFTHIKAIFKLKNKKD